MIRMTTPAVLAAAFALIAAAPAEADALAIASLEWPPYSGAALDEGGTSIDIVRQAFAAAGHDLAVEFLPWERAVRAGTQEPGFVGYGPEYYDPALDAEAGGERCLFSRPYQTGPLGLVEATEADIDWAAPEDLSRYRIGVVDGYLNTPAFDALVADGTIAVDVSADDLTNVRKVAHGRIDAAVIDANVLAWLLANEPALADAAGRVAMDDRLLAEKTLHICFRNDAAGRAARAAFHAGLDALDQ